MEKLVQFLAESLVEEPEAVQVSVRQSQRTTVIRLTVAPEDMGRVIGKGGRVANAIRDVLRVGAPNDDNQVILKIA